MYFKEYILPLWYFPISIIFLLCSIYYFLFRIIAVRRFQAKKRIEKRNFRYLHAFIAGLVIIIISIPSGNNINIFLGIILIGQGFWVYDYNFFLDEGLFIKGKFIQWNKVSNLEYKSKKAMMLSYFKSNQDSKISKVTFNIGYNSRLELENTLKSRKDSLNIISVRDEDKIYLFKGIKIGLSLALILLTMVFAYGIYSLVQPKDVGVVLEEVFQHSDTSTVVIYHYHEVNPNMYSTSNEGKIREIKNYFNSVHIRKIQHNNLKYNFMFKSSYEIVLYQLNGDKVEIITSNKDPVIEIIRNNKKRSYFIEEGYKELEFINKIVQIIG